MNPITNSDEMEEFLSARGTEVMLREEGNEQDSTGLIETMQSDIELDQSSEELVETKKLE